MSLAQLSGGAGVRKITAGDNAPASFSDQCPVRPARLEPVVIRSPQGVRASRCQAHCNHDADLIDGRMSREDQIHCAATRRQGRRPYLGRTIWLADILDERIEPHHVQQALQLVIKRVPR